MIGSSSVGSRLLVGVLERHRAGDLERHLRRVDGVVRAVDEPDADALDRRAGELAVRHRLLDALVDRRPEALRDHAADDLVDELVADVALAAARSRSGSRRTGRGRRSASCSGPARAPPCGSSRRTARAAGAARPRRRSGSSAGRPRPRRASGSSPRAAARRSAGRGGAASVGSSSARRRSALRDLVLVALRLRRDREAHHRLGEVELRQLDLALGVERAGRRSGRPSASRPRRCRRRRTRRPARAPCPAASAARRSAPSPGRGR